MRAGRSLAVAAAALVLAAQSASGLPQTKDQQKCTAAMNKALGKVASALGTQINACIKDGAKGMLAGPIESCLAADPRGTVAKAAAKAEKAFGKLCAGNSRKDPTSPRLPPYGATGAATVQATATDLGLSLVHDVFGADLDAAIIRAATDRAAAKCQQSVAKQVKGCAASQLNAFTACKKQGLKDPLAPFDGPEDLESCIGADPKGTVAKHCDQPMTGGAKPDAIRKALDKKCERKGVSLATAFPGCAQDDAEETHACLETAIDCRVCLALNRADGLARDCDLFDDDSTNGSCVAPLILGRHQCVLTPDSGLVFETAVFFDLFSVSGAIDIDCGTVDATTGRAACSCAIDHIDPIPIVPGIGVACVRPAAGCPAGEIGCGGGGQYNASITSLHNVGTCTSNADCASQCATTCGVSSASVFGSGCEGFCRGGTNADQACTTDAGCAAGTCNGLDGVTHGNICQCECLDSGGDPSLPGGMRCNLGISVDVEMAVPCGDGDVLFRVGDRCVPFTTEAAQGVIVDANNVSGAQIPEGLDIYGGLPLECTDLAGEGTGGLVLASRVNALDVELAGDTALAFVLACE